MLFQKKEKGKLVHSNNLNTYNVTIYSAKYLLVGTVIKVTDT